MLQRQSAKNPCPKCLQRAPPLRAMSQKAGTCMVAFLCAQHSSSSLVCTSRGIFRRCHPRHVQLGLFARLYAGRGQLTSTRLWCFSLCSKRISEGVAEASQAEWNLLRQIPPGDPITGQGTWTLPWRSTLLAVFQLPKKSRLWPASL